MLRVRDASGLESPGRKHQFSIKTGWKLEPLEMVPHIMWAEGPAYRPGRGAQSEADVLRAHQSVKQNRLQVAMGAESMDGRSP